MKSNQSVEKVGGVTSAPGASERMAGGIVATVNAQLVSLTSANKMSRWTFPLSELCVHTLRIHPQLLSALPHSPLGRPLI